MRLLQLLLAATGEYCHVRSLCVVVSNISSSSYDDPPRCVGARVDH